MSRYITHIFYEDTECVPTLSLSDGKDIRPLDTALSLSFDLTQRYCIGWHDLATGESHPCPENATTDKKFETCPACQRRTGFNPAFYHTDKVSAKQEARNAEPHRLYLAYMGSGYIKVGISWDNRGNKRLLDQGARAGLALETFPTALIARQYEAKIARLPDMHETTSTRTKLALLSVPFDEASAKEQLLAAKQHIEAQLSVAFSGAEVQFFDKYYSSTKVPSGDIVQQTTPLISGTVQALVGDIVLTRYNDRVLALPLKPYIGYPIEISDQITPLDLEPQQMQLF